VDEAGHDAVSPGRPAIFGEILFDRFPDGMRVLGGAPLNVAAHLGRLGAAPRFVGRVGADAAGDAVLERFARLGIDRSGVQRDPELPTGEVDVRLDAGEPAYDILPDRAWDRIELAPARAALAAQPPALLYHGVLAARSERSRETLRALRREARAPLFVDVNLRAPWTPLDRARELARGAAWLKVSRDELARLGEASPAGDDRELARQAGRFIEARAVEHLVVTWGERGAWLFDADGGVEHAHATPIDRERLVDPVGAGDAMAAALVLGLLRGWSPGRALVRGGELAAAVCSIRGAIPADDAFYDPFRERWGIAR